MLQFTLDDGSGTDRTILIGICEDYEPEDLIEKTAIAIVNLPPRKMMGIDSGGGEAVLKRWGCRTSDTKITGVTALIW